MIGLKRGTVRLESHQDLWELEAQEVIKDLREVPGDIALEIQHVGSTAIRSICAKPIVDIAVGVRDLAEVKPLTEVLAKRQIILRQEDIPGQLLFVKGDFSQDTRSHHIHFVRWNDPAWIDYIDFRDYLNANANEAARYEKVKIKLARRFPASRQEYTAGKQRIIAELLRSARQWRRQTEGCTRLIHTPFGPVQAVASKRHLLELNFGAGALSLPDTANPILDQAEKWLTCYFAGEKVSPVALPLSPDGTPFQRKLWQILQNIPYGETVTYGEIARLIAPSMSARAVGSAVGANPLPVIIPCHRVVATDNIGGYSGGIKIKQSLLALEKANIH